MNLTSLCQHQLQYNIIIDIHITISKTNTIISEIDNGHVYNLSVISSSMTLSISIMSNDTQHDNVHHNNKICDTQHNDTNFCYAVCRLC